MSDPFQAIAAYIDRCERAEKECAAMRAQLKPYKDEAVRLLHAAVQERAAAESMTAQRDALLEALKECVGQIIQTGCDLGADAMPPCVDRARRAIARATTGEKS